MKLAHFFTGRYHPFLLLVVFSGIPFVLPRAVAGSEMKSAKLCSSCHAEIYNAWNGGAHARSWENLVYHAGRAGYIKAAAETGTVFCERCHAPVAYLTGDRYFMNPVSTEGVTCDVCHTMVESEEDQGLDEPIDGEVKIGPTGDCPSGLHGCRKQEGMDTAEFCASCHHYVNRAGLTIYTEYQDWKRSRFASDAESCVGCHVQRGESAQSGGGIHKLIPLKGPGGLLQKAVILSMSMSMAEETILTVRVKNSVAGHSVPGGPPIRSIRLDVRGYNESGTEVFTDTTTVLTRVVEGPISPGTGMTIPWLGWREVRDDRLPPGMSRVFTYATGRQDVVRAAAKALYIRFDMVVEEDFFGEDKPPVMAYAKVQAR